jgi:hypothetical protein
VEPERIGPALVLCGQPDLTCERVQREPGGGIEVHSRYSLPLDGLGTHEHDGSGPAPTVITASPGVGFC